MNLRKTKSLSITALVIFSLITLTTLAPVSADVKLLDVNANDFWCDFFGIGCPPPPPPPPSTGQSVPWGISRINADTAQLQTDETGVVIAIIDTGLDMDHEDLQGLFIWGYSYYAQGASGGWFSAAPITEAECTQAVPDACNDDNDHGSHVAGTIAAQDNNVGVLGVAPDVGLYIFKALDSQGSGAYSAISGSIIKATDGPDGIVGTADDADVISMSLGGSSGTVELENAVNYALNNGVIIVAATGNDGASSPSYPAAYPGVMKVGAIDSNNNIASFSNRGEDLFAPGVGVKSSISNGGYDTFDGTSMATPHVAGVVALAIAAHPTYTSTQIKNLVINSQDSFGVVDAAAVV